MVCIDKLWILVSLEAMKPVGRWRRVNHVKIHGYEGSCLLISRLTMRRRLMRPAAWMVHRRPRVAAAPRPARPMPPANTGLSKRASKENGDVVGGGVDVEAGVGADVGTDVVCGWMADIVLACIFFEVQYFYRRDFAKLPDATTRSLSVCFSLYNRTTLFFQRDFK